MPVHCDNWCSKDRSPGLPEVRRQSWRNTERRDSSDMVTTASLERQELRQSRCAQSTPRSESLGLRTTRRVPSTSFRQQLASCWPVADLLPSREQTSRFWLTVRLRDAPFFGASRPTSVLVAAPSTRGQAQCRRTVRRNRARCCPTSSRCKRISRRSGTVDRMRKRFAVRASGIRRSSPILRKGCSDRGLHRFHS
jgi:hypothetical protein